MALLCALTATGQDTIFLSVSFTTMPFKSVSGFQLPENLFERSFPYQIHSNFSHFLESAPSIWKFDVAAKTECCGFLWRAGLSLTAQDQMINIGLTLHGLPFLCCGLTFDAVILFSGPGRTFAVQPRWEGWRGPSLEIYGDPLRFEIFGWGLQYEIGSLRIQELVALNPERMRELSRIPFYPGERTYWGLRYIVSSLTLTSEFWLGEGEIPFNFKRTKLSLAVPIYEGFEVVVEGEWDFSTEDPFDLLNIRWEVEF